MDLWQEDVWASLKEPSGRRRSKNSPKKSRSRRPSNRQHPESEALAQAITDLLRHPEESRDMGRRARQRCLASYTLAETSRLLEEVVLRVADAV